MKKKLIILCVFIVSCSSGVVEFSPKDDVLPSAKVGTYYQQNIVLTFKGSGEVISLSSNNLRAKITPENYGLKIEPDFSECDEVDMQKCSGYNKITIKGMPNVRGVIDVEVIGRTYASMYSKSQTFKKEYKIIVE